MGGIDYWRRSVATSRAKHGEPSTVVFTATMALPDLPQNPITSLVAHGFDKGTPLPGNVCPSQAYDETYTRTGD
jgi:hypothetical protein